VSSYFRFPRLDFVLFFLITSCGVVVSFMCLKSPKGGILSRKFTVPTKAFGGVLLSVQTFLKSTLQYATTTSFCLLLNSSYIIILSSLMTEAKTFRTFIRIYSLFKSERLSASIKLTLNKALIRSVMTYACPHPCGGWVEYLHRDPASRKRRRNGTKKRPRHSLSG
jgi:hypothetical protein